MTISRTVWFESDGDNIDLYISADSMSEFQHIIRDVVSTLNETTKKQWRPYSETIRGFIFPGYQMEKESKFI